MFRRKFSKLVSLAKGTVLCLRPATEVEAFQPQLKGGVASLTNRKPPTSDKAAYASLARFSIVMTMCISIVSTPLINQDLLDNPFSWS